MASPSRSRHALLALAAGVGVFATPGPGLAQQAGDGFLFRAPTVTLSLYGGLARPDAGSDVFAFTTEQLTLGRGDFNAPALGSELAVHLTPRVALTLGAAYAGRTSRSEFRDWVDGDDLPIEQNTEFARVPVTAGVKAYLTPPGRSIGQFAWVPARYAPYLGAGGGAMWYRFRQTGEFVDFETLDIFRDEIESSGWTPTAQGVAGLDLSLSPRLVLTGEARYLWARAPMGGGFEGFDPIDLSGLSATLGFSVRF
jgi:hypothetical protein